MGKGFNSAKNKQLDLARKMELAKKKNSNKNDGADVEIGLQDNGSKDHEEFAKLLRDHQPPVETATISSDPSTERLFIESPPPIQNPTGPKIRAKDLKRRKKKERQKDENETEEDVEETQMQIGDKASRVEFEELVEVETGSKLGPVRAAALVPWVPPFLKDYLLVLADPRKQSNDLARAIEYISSSNEEIAENCIAVASDPVPALVSLQSRLEDGETIRLFSDSNLKWMKLYSCVENRWVSNVRNFEHLIFIEN